MTWGGVESGGVAAGVVDDFLNAASREPAALLIEGEAGIGKTTLWLAATDRARELGTRVLSARTAATESLLAYGALADLLDEVDESVLVALPAPQRVAMERILLRVTAAAPVTDQRTVAAGFLSVVEVLATRGPVVLAFDDLQWLDVSSQHIVAFAARRLTGPVRMLATVRADDGVDTSAAWLQLHRPDALTRLRLQ